MRVRDRQPSPWIGSPSGLGCRLLIGIGWLMVATTLLASDPYIRHFRAGAVVGANIDAEFSQSGFFGADTGPLGPFSGGWEFDDGFVHPDDSVGGAAGGRTSNWGYNSGAQYDAGAETLTYSRASGFSVTDSSTANSDPHFGLDLGYGGSIGRVGKTWFLWDLGFSLLPINVQGDSSAGASIAQQTYVFDTTGLIVPGAPYTGSPSGGPLLATNFTSGSSGITPGTLTAEREIEVILYNLRLGPQVHWDLTKAWSVELMAGGAVGFVDGSYDFSETLITATGQSRTTGSINQSDWVYGGYAGLMTHLHIERNAYIYGGVQWMSLSNVGFSEGGRSASLRLDQGIYFSIGFNWLF